MPARTVDFGSVLARLVRSTVMEDGDLSSVLRTITEAAAATLQVERVNIWLFDRARTRIRCIQAYERGARLGRPIVLRGPSRASYRGRLRRSQ